MQNNEKIPSAVRLKVIEGGGSAIDQAESPPTHCKTVGAATAYALAEEARLREAILRTSLDRTKATVRQALDELAVLDASSEDEEVQVRIGTLQAGLEWLGVTFIRKHHRPDREGARWVLSHPDRLMAANPSVAALYPRAHHMLVVRWDESECDLGTPAAPETSEALTQLLPE